MWKEVDPRGETVRLSKDAYVHICKCHPVEALLVETAKDTIRNPVSIWRDIDENSKVWYYFNELKKEKHKLLGVENPYVVVVVKEVDEALSIASWYFYAALSKKGAREIWKRK